MRWFLVLFVLFINGFCVPIVTAAVASSNTSPFLDEPETTGSQSPDITAVETSLQPPKQGRVHALRRNRRHMPQEHDRIRWNHGYLTRSAMRKKKLRHKHHHHRHHRKPENFEFVLKCPVLPENEPRTTTKIGVEWSRDSEAYLRILSTGKRYESMYISKVEEWRNIGGQLNVLAHGPRPNDTRYKFEYEEARGWFSFKIKSVTFEDVGTWQCRIKLKFPNSTIQQFESRKKIYLENNVPTFKKNLPQAILTSKSSYISRLPISTPLDPPPDDTINNAFNYSEPPLFSFSKNEGEYAVFSRVDKKRDLLAYIRPDYKPNKTKNEKKKRFYFCPISSNAAASTTATFICIFTFLITTVWISS